MDLTYQNSFNCSWDEIYSNIHSQQTRTKKNKKQEKPMLKNAKEEKLDTHN